MCIIQKHGETMLEAILIPGSLSLTQFVKYAIMYNCFLAIFILICNVLVYLRLFLKGNGTDVIMYKVTQYNRIFDVITLIFNVMLLLVLSLRL